MKAEPDPLTPPYRGILSDPDFQTRMGIRYPIPGPVSSDDDTAEIIDPDRTLDLPR